MRTLFTAGDVDRRCAVLGHCDMQWLLRAVGDDWGIEVDIGEGRDVASCAANANTQFGRRGALYRFRGIRSGVIPLRVIPAFHQNLNSIQNSARIV
jgi:hypothetical protein